MANLKIALAGLGAITEVVNQVMGADKRGEFRNIQERPIVTLNQLNQTKENQDF